jgi:hypothetical protein
MTAVRLGVIDFFVRVLSAKLGSQRSWRTVRAPVANADRMAMLSEVLAWLLS